MLAELGVQGGVDCRVGGPPGRVTMPLPRVWLPVVTCVRRLQGLWQLEWSPGCRVQTPSAGGDAWNGLAACLPWSCDHWCQPGPEARPRLPRACNRSELAGLRDQGARAAAAGTFAASAEPAFAVCFSRRASVIDPRRLTHLAQLAVARRASSSHLAHSSKASALPAHTSSCLYTFSADGDSLLSSKPCPTSTASYFIYPSGA